MVTKSWMYDMIIYIYALSLLFYFFDFVERNQKLKRMGTGFLAFVWLLQTIFLFLRMGEVLHPAVFSMFDSLFLFSWMMVTLSLALNYFFRIDLLVFFLNVLGFAVSALNFFSDESVLPMIGQWEIEDELLFIHVSLAIASYVSYMIGAVFSGMYLFLHRQLKEKQWSTTMKRLPSLEKIEKYNAVSIMIGTPLLILSLALGVVWVILKSQLLLLFDPKVLNSIVILAAYGIYLVKKISRRTAGRKLALWSLASFSLVILNYLVSNFYSNFHQWIWM